MKEVIVTTSWDDGHKLDIRLAALLKKYDVPGTFYVSPRDHEIKKADRLTDEQIKDIAQDFEIGAHTMTHPRLTAVTDTQARREMRESKNYLEKLLGKTVTSFCYPGGNYLKHHVTMAAEVGFTYARTVKRFYFGLHGAPQESHTSVNTYNHYQDLWKIFKFARYNPFKVPRLFHWENLAKAMFDRVQRDGGVFHLWGHSWEVDGHGDWEKLEGVLKYISGKKNVRYVTNGELSAVVKPRLLLVTPYFPPKTGGVERYAAEMAKGALADGYDVTIITSALDGRKTSVTEENGARVYRLKPTFWLSQTPIGLGWYWQIRRIIRKERPDIINTHAPVPFMADVAALAAGRTPVVATYHAGAMRKGRFVEDTLLRFYETCILPLSLGKARTIICGSNFVRDTFLARYRHKSTTITPGVDVDYFVKPEHRPDGQRVLFVGNAVSGNKGLDILEKAVADMPDVTLHVVGEVAEKSDQQNVVYHGVLRGKALVRQYQNARVFVLPSTGKTESFGMVLIEAMACGVPVIGTDVGGIPLVIDDKKTGLIVPPASPEALTDAIRSLLDNPEKAAKFSNRAYQKVQSSYAWPHLAKKYNAVLRSVIEKAKG
jgi:glycosyltransferase involved in cell wall biosynthesis/peptidoglycan/xylan/chitin deacetylase (PgdA/CDA1 family)